MNAESDLPKMLREDAAIKERYRALTHPRIVPLCSFVSSLRAEMGCEAKIPDFDPWDGGIEAEVLYLLEAPGAKAVKSGFISRNNPDETAKNFFELNRDARIARERTITWNIVPWYIGSQTRIRAANRRDASAGISSLVRLLALLSNLKAVVLVGKKARYAEPTVVELMPRIRVFHSPHPSPLFVNNAPGNRDRIAAVLREVRAFLQ